MYNELKREKRDTAESILGQKSGPALAGPAGPAMTALLRPSFILGQRLIEDDD